MDETSFRKILTVSELTRTITELLEEAFPFVWVQGEISGLALPGSGHIYFTLKDDASQIRVAMFKNQARTLGISSLRPLKVEKDTREPSFFQDKAATSEAGGRLLQDGRQVLVLGRISVYAPRGEYQLIADHIEPVGIGAMTLALEELKRKLSEKGYFEPARKKPLPFLPLRIAIVTSPTGAALFDMLKIIYQRMPRARVLVVPVRVQGEEAPLEIAHALALVDREKLADVVIVGRGGGSIEDLWAFNTEVVADAVFSSSIPIISAVGHEIDFTVADLVADVRAPTPTAAAQLATPRIDDLLMTLDSAAARMRARAQNLIFANKERLVSLTRRIRYPRREFERFRLRITVVYSRLRSAASAAVGTRDNTFSSLAHALERLSPRAVLARGYAVVERADDGHLIKSTSDIGIGRSARIRLSRGTLLARIDKKETDESS